MLSIFEAEAEKGGYPMAHQLRMQISTNKRPKSWNPEKMLADALAERALFLDSHPEYKPFQREIDMLLDKAGSSENRMTVLAVLMEAKLIELHEQLKRLNTILIRKGAAPVQRSINRNAYALESDRRTS
jgi:hypothetical protein